MRLIILFLVAGFFFISCESNSKPYAEYESRLEEYICDCVRLSSISNDDSFLIEYEKCSIRLADFLSTGLDSYIEDERLTKEAYKEKIPDIVTSITSQCFG